MTSSKIESFALPLDYATTSDAAAAKGKLQADAVTTNTELPAQPPSDRVIDRSQFYISQLKDRDYKSFLFGCGATSLCMALADFDLPGYRPPSEAKRVDIMNFTGVMAAGQFPGGPKLMADDARHYGLQAEDRSGCVDINVLDQELKKGRGCIVNGPDHFVYIAGKAQDGSYIVGDPSYPAVSRWTGDHLSQFMRASGNGFTAVWKGEYNSQRSVVNDAAVSMLAPPVISRGDNKQSALPEPIESGGNGSALGSTGGSSGGALFGGNGPGRMADVPSGVSTGQSSYDESAYYASLPQTKLPHEKKEVVSGIDMQVFTDKLVYGISKNEGSFETINPNDGGFGISVGIMQWNQKVGQLPELFQAMLEDDATQFLDLCGPEFSHAIMDQDGHKVDASKVRQLSFKNYMSQLQKLLANKQMQQVQIKLARKQIIEGEKVGSQNGFKSEAGLAIVVDVVNQAGIGAVNKAMKEADVARIVETKGEQAGIQALENALHLPSGQQRDGEVYLSGTSFCKPPSTSLS